MSLGATCKPFTRRHGFPQAGDCCAVGERYRKWRNAFRHSFCSVSKCSLYTARLSWNSSDFAAAPKLLHLDASRSGSRNNRFILVSSAAARLCRRKPTRAVSLSFGKGDGDIFDCGQQRHMTYDIACFVTAAVWFGTCCQFYFWRVKFGIPAFVMGA